MARQSVGADIEAIITNKTLTRQKQIKALEKMHGEVRAQMRAATESAMVDEDDLGEELRQIEEALESLGTTSKTSKDSQDDRGPATL